MNYVAEGVLLAIVFFVIGIACGAALITNGIVADCKSMNQFRTSQGVFVCEVKK